MATMAEPGTQTLANTPKATCDETKLRIILHRLGTRQAMLAC